MIAGIIGRQPTAGEEVDLAAFIDKDFLIVVAPTDSGGSRVETVIAAPSDT